MHQPKYFQINLKMINIKYKGLSEIGYEQTAITVEIALITYIVLTA